MTENDRAQFLVTLTEGSQVSVSYYKGDGEVVSTSPLKVRMTTGKYAGSVVVVHYSEVFPCPK